MEEITFFAKTNFRNQNVKFGIKTSDRQRHMYVIGKTGMGKTNLLENIVMQDIANGHGIAYIDPHGDTAEKLIKAIPANRINDVVYFNPADTEFPIAFNILESVSEDKKHLVASGMMGVFKKIWPDVWSARMEYILSNALLALLDYPGSTMMGVNRMMSDKKYRQRVYEKIKDPVVKGFWIDEFETWEDRFRKEAVAAIQNKVGQFLSSFLIRNIVGQTKSTINMREIMDNNKILIVNLSKGRIGEDAMRLLGGMIVTKIQLAAMERVDMPEEDRKNFYLTVDEFQNFVTESFANILSEARKYRLNLLVAHQYINQLVTENSSVVKDAIFGNVGTIISFRVGAEDAEFLEKEFEPVFMMNDIVNLPKYNIYLKLMIDGIAGNAFSAAALPPIDIELSKENAEKVIRSSRERYAKDRSEIEEKIARWTGMLTKESLPAGMIKSGPVFENPAKNNYSKNQVSTNSNERFSIRKESVNSKVSTGFNLKRESVRNVAPEIKKPEIEKKEEIMRTTLEVSNVKLERSIGIEESLPETKKEIENNETKLNSAIEVPNLKEVDFKLSQNNFEIKTEEVKEDDSAPEIKTEEMTEGNQSLEIKLEEVKNPEIFKQDNGSGPVIDKKEVYVANCDTCGVEIQIPFKPDGERPTFCKDCLKDYQRAIARIQNEENENRSRIARDSRSFTQDKKEYPIKDETRPAISGKIETQQKVYKSNEKPLKLAQTQFMAPKKIRDMAAGRELSKLREILEKNNKIKDSQGEENVD